MTDTPSPVSHAELCAHIDQLQKQLAAVTVERDEWHDAHDDKVDELAAVARERDRLLNAIRTHHDQKADDRHVGDKNAIS